MKQLPNYLQAQWQMGTGPNTTIYDPITNEAVAEVNANGIDMATAYAWVREHALPPLQKMTYAERAQCLSQAVDVLKANRDKYFTISEKNSGTVKKDTSVDVDGGIYTLSWYAKAGQSLGDNTVMLDGTADSLSRDGSFVTQTLKVPNQGLALLINAFNFPSWGLWEKAAPALLSGVPIVVKPATATAWLTFEMVKDIIDANIFPEGAISLVCGRPDGLVDALNPMDLLSFTGSADTAAQLRLHPLVAEQGLRFNAETDSINSALLLQDASPELTQLYIKEVVNEIRTKSGQKCTAIRRAFVPAEHYQSIADQLHAALAPLQVGDPRKDGIDMGALASQQQYQTVLAGLDQFKAELDLIFDGQSQSPIQVDHDSHACVAPMLFGTGLNKAVPQLVHEVEIFGPVATLIPYQNYDDLAQMVKQGGGSLVCSIFGDQAEPVLALSQQIAPYHGRVNWINTQVAATQTGHGNVMPQSIHGGPGRAGGGEELGGLRALDFYHRRLSTQGPATYIQQLNPSK